MEVGDLHASDPTSRRWARGSVERASMLSARYGRSAHQARGATMRSQLPPGPRTPVFLQTIGWWSRPTAYLERCRARYGRRFTIRLLGQPPFVVLSDPEEIKELF